LADTDLGTIWNSEAARRSRRGLTAGDMAAAGCATCAFRGRRDIETFPHDPTLGQPPFIAENIRCQNAEYLAGTEVLESFPSLAVIQFTEACNLECAMCFQSHEPTNLAPAFRDAILRYAHRFDEIQFTGGEPFVSKWVQAFLRDFDVSSGTKLSFTTNATLLHRFKEEVERLPRAHFGLSIDAARPETYKRIRKGGDWAQVKENVEWIAALRRNRRRLWGTTRLAFIIMRSNFEEIPAFIQWACRQEMPVMFSPVWGEFADGENIFDHPDLRQGLTPPADMMLRAERLAAALPDYERKETVMSLRYSLERLK